MKKSLPIGMDSFEKVREGDYYYVDKTLMIREFLEMRDEAALIARPRRFGKTLNMTMLREFFDITKDSHSLFQGLAIMDTRYADGINTLPVIYVTFKDCKGQTSNHAEAGACPGIRPICQHFGQTIKSRYFQYKTIF